MAIDDVMGGRRRRAETGRRSGGRALVFWLIALMAGGAAAVLVRWYMDRTAMTAGPALIKIVVTATDLPVATTLRAENLKLVDWPEAALPTGAILDAKEATGRVLVTKMVRGEVLLASKLASRDKGQGLAALIPESMRAVAVRVDDVVGVAGFIHPEDRVDVIVTLRPQKPADSEPVSKVILQNVKVLAVGQELDGANQRSRPMPVTVATLLVTVEQSEKLALAAVEGRLLLTLRSWTDDSTAETPGVVPTGLLAGVKSTLPRPMVANEEDRSSRRSSRSRKEGPPPVAAAPVNTAPQKEVVEILRGDRFEERKFEPQGKDKQ